jgi:DNA repair exonuclease SbcCD ATPase subunit
MAFVSEIVAKLGLDTSAFKAALTKTTADVGRASEDMGGKLRRAFGAGDVFKGLLQGLGIASIQSVVDKLTSGFREAAENAKDLQKISEETADVYEKIFEARRSDEENLSNLRQRDLRLANEEKRIREGAAKLVPKSIPLTGITLMSPTGTTPEQEKRSREIALERAKIQQQSESIQRRIQTAEEGRMQKLDDENTAYQEGLGKLAEDQSAFQRSQLNNQQQLGEATKEKIALEMKLADDIALSGDEELAIKRRILEIDKEIQRVNEAITDDAKKRNEESQTNEKKRSKAKADVAESERAVIQQRRDRSGLTVAELAAGVAGTSQTTKAKAREIQRLEQQARRQRAGGFTVEAEASTSRALQLRSQLEPLTSGEKDPLAGAAEQLETANEHLASIDENLKATSIQ